MAAATGTGAATPGPVVTAGTVTTPAPTWEKIGSPPHVTGGNITPNRRPTGVSR